MKEKLLNIQQELKCNKGQYNSFGKYKYRSCEDILESVKPLLKENGCIITLNDTLEYIGNRYYIKAVVTISDVKSGEAISNTAYAREEEDKKGMDGSQITGTSSSYARKYALNGLFAIDDTKDTDTDEYTKQTMTKEEQELILIYIDKMNKLVAETDTDYEELLKYFNVKSNSEMTLQQLKQAVAILEKKKVKNKEEVF